MFCVHLILPGLLFLLCSGAQSVSPGHLSSPDTGTIQTLNRTAAKLLQTDPDSSFYYASLANKHAEKTEYPSGGAEALLHLSNYYNIRGNYSQAMSHALDALHIFDSLHLPAAMADVYAQIAYIYKTMAGQNRTPAYLNSGIAMSRQAYEKYSLAADTAGMANSLNITGILYRDKYYAESVAAYFDTAFYCYRQAMQMITSSGAGEQYLGKLYNNTSQYYSEYKKEYHQGIDWLMKALEFNHQRNNRTSLLYNYGNISFCYRQLKDYTQARAYAERMLKGAEEMGQPLRRHDALYELYQTFKEEGQYAEALEYYILADRITDSLSNADKTREVAEIRGKFETEKKESEIKRLHTEKGIIQQRNVFLSAGLGLFFLLSIALVVLYKRTQRQKQEIADQSLRLTVMMKELHHRVKNNLQVVSSLLSLQSYKATDENAVSAFRETQQRVQAMSLIHQRLYHTGDLMAVDMKEYITDLAESLLASFGFEEDGFGLEINVDKEKLDVEKALPIGLIINEIVTNAMKYAYSGLLRPELLISMTENQQHIILQIKDNGQGMDLTAWQQNKGFGRQLIRALCRQLNASEQILVNGGTGYTLSIPTSRAA